MRTRPAPSPRAIPSRQARGRRWSTAALAVGLLVIASCAEDEPGVGATDAAGTDVAVAETSLGEVLVDGDGMTLYMFDADEAGAPTCYDACAQAWPPLIVDDDPVAGAGVDAALLSTTARDDGSQQVTYAGWPLYHWAGDSSPGDVDGQAVDDAWWVMTADGDVVRDEDASEPADDESPSRGGYY